MTWINTWFQNEKYTPMAQVIVAFVFGILLSPFSSGLFFLTVFIVVYEILYYLFINPLTVVPYGGYDDPLGQNNYNPRCYNIFVRVSVMIASILGFIVGRTLSGDNILQEGVPNIPWAT